MQTLSEHNLSYEQMFRELGKKEQKQKKECCRRQEPAGIKCPMCKIRGQETEMIYHEQGVWKPKYYWKGHWSNPVRCPNCGYKDYKKDVCSWRTF